MSYEERLRRQLQKIFSVIEKPRRGTEDQYTTFYCTGCAGARAKIKELGGRAGARGKIKELGGGRGPRCTLKDLGGVTTPYGEIIVPGGCP